MQFIISKNINLFQLSSNVDTVKAFSGDKSGNRCCGFKSNILTKVFIESSAN